MAHVVVSSSSSVSGAVDGVNDLKKKGIKETLGQRQKEDVIERRKEDARDRVELERKRVREGEIAKRRLRVLATQRCQTEQETIESLEQINQMSPEDALRTLDLHLAKAEAGFADKMSISIRDGVGSILDRLLRANGCISARFRSDHALQSALTNELGYIATFVSNKAVIALSAASDVVGGYQDSILSGAIEQSSKKATDSKNGDIERKVEFVDLTLPAPFIPPVIPFDNEVKEEGIIKEKKKKKEKKKQCLKIKVNQHPLLQEQ